MIPAGNGTTHYYRILWRATEAEFNGQPAYSQLAHTLERTLIATHELKLAGPGAWLTRQLRDCGWVDGLYCAKRREGGELNGTYSAQACALTRWGSRREIPLRTSQIFQDGGQPLVLQLRGGWQELIGGQRMMGWNTLWRRCEHGHSDIGRDCRR